MCLASTGVGRAPIWETAQTALASLFLTVSSSIQAGHRDSDEGRYSLAESPEAYYQPLLISARLSKKANRVLAKLCKRED